VFSQPSDERRFKYRQSGVETGEAATMFPPNFGV
jgi:hypothetical protein